MKKIQILGTGCPKCKKLAENAVLVFRPIRTVAFNYDQRNFPKSEVSMTSSENKNTNVLTVKPIGLIHSPFSRSESVPIQPAFAEGYEGTVEIYNEFEEALLDLEGFERIWLLYWFDRASQFKAKVKPYMNDRWHGLFATRAPSRPNPIGLSCVKLLSVKANILHVSDIDILDGTPLLDIKPYIGKFDRYEVKRNGWLDDAEKGDIKSDERFYNKQKKARDTK